MSGDCNGSAINDDLINDIKGRHGTTKSYFRWSRCLRRLGLYQFLEIILMEIFIMSAYYLSSTVLYYQVYIYIYIYIYIKDNNEIAICRTDNLTASLIML